MRSRRRMLDEDESLKDLWPSFADVTSTIALIMFVLMLLAYVKNLISGKRLDELQGQIVLSQQQLRGLQDRLSLTSRDVEAGQRRLALSEAALADQQKVIADSNRELGTLRTRLSGIAVLRLDVLNKVKGSIEGELGATAAGGAPIVRIGDTGNIVLNESLVFEYNSYELKPEGRRVLDTLASALGKVLADTQVRENVDTILVQGHTDERGSSAFNRDLSAKRANAVVDYLFESNPELEQNYGAYFASCAYSEFRPLDPALNEAAYAQNRRIEVSLVIKDGNVRNVIDDYVKNLDPSLGAPSAPAP
ncbi:MAG: OmpA family protein [Polyangiaceae bacterium]